jgi:hypothetical protein
LRQHVADEIVPRVTPEGRLSFSRCMIRMIAPVRVSFRRLYSVWSNQSFAAWRWACDSASSGFSGSSMMIRSAPRPVSTPPTEVASRQPWVRANRQECEGSVGRSLSRIICGRRREIPWPPAQRETSPIGVASEHWSETIPGAGRLDLWRSGLSKVD